MGHRIDMLHRFAPVRRRRPSMQTRQVDEARSLLDGTFDGFEVRRSRSDRFFLTVGGGRAGGVTIAYIRSGGQVGVAGSGAFDEYRIMLPLQRPAEMVVGDRAIDCDTGRAAIASPMDRHIINSDGVGERLWVSVSQAAVTRAASTLLGEGLDRPVRFEPSIDLASRQCRSLFNTLAFVGQEVCDEASLFSNPFLRRDLEELVVNAMLIGLRHSLSDRLSGPARQVASRDVVRAVEYIRANLLGPVTLQDLAQAAGVPGRTLREHFRRTHGLSPMAYLRKVRLEKARELLLGEPEISVTEAAMRSGFEHLGRFAAFYRSHFGESPSKTVSRRR